MNMKTNMDYLTMFCTERSINMRTKSGYQTTINKYCGVHQMSIDELLKEADREEEDGIRLKKRTLKKRLLKFREYLVETSSSKTVKTYMSRIVTFYKHFEIEVPELPKLNTKSLKEYEPIYYEDLPDKEIIKEAINISTPQLKALILFQCSSGCARRESLNLTINDFLKATKEYYNEDMTNITDILFRLKKQSVIPTFKIIRQKTNKPYYTFCTPEATEAICNYLLTRENLNIKDSLFDMCEVTYTNHFNRINDTLRLGRVGAFNRFRGHMLRKFHASNLYQGENHLSIDEVDALQGRTRGGSRGSYFMDDTEVLRNRYIKAMSNVMINYTVTYITLDNEESAKLIKDYENDLADSYSLISELKNKNSEVSNYAKAFNQSLNELGL